MLSSAGDRKQTPRETSHSCLDPSQFTTDKCENGDEVFTCVKVEGTRSRRNLKKSVTEGSTNSDRAVYIAVCTAQSNDGQTYVGVGQLNRWPVKVL